MKQMVLEGDTPFLPQEIIRIILTRLPVKSLLRFQCVCKHWKDLFKTQSFIMENLHHSSHQNPFILSEQNSKDHPLNLDLLDCDMQVRKVQSPPLNVSFWWGVNVIGSCNGLLCLELEEYDKYTPSFVLWNPAIREARQVPRTIYDFKGSCYSGFGFSPIVNDYKIVRIYEIDLDNDFDYDDDDDGFVDDDDEVKRVEVYSLSTGSWKEVKFGNLESVSFSSETITVNGTMFWFGSKLNDLDNDYAGYNLIVSFDMGKEVFTSLPMPPLDSTVNEKLTVYENKLAVLSIDYENESYLINLWVMEEGTSASWERRGWIGKYTSSPSPFILHPATIWKNKVVFEPEDEVENDERRTVLYMFNLATSEFKKFAIPRSSVVDGIFNYVESLVSVGNNDIESIDPKS